MAIILSLIIMLCASEFEEISARLCLDSGMALLEQGLLEQAEREFNRALEFDGSCPEAILGLGMVQRARESWPGAVESFRQFIALAPDDHRGFLQLSGLYLETGKADSAVLMADSAFSRLPTDPGIWLQCGRTRHAADDLWGAESWYSRVLQENSEGSRESACLLAEVYRRTDRSQAAEQLLLPYADAGYSPAWWGLARVYLQWNDYLRAGQAMDMYLYLSPEGFYADSAFLVLEELGESGNYIR